jgi:hypothetical protein
LIGFFALTIIINVSGKGNLSPSSASDQVQNYVLGGIIGGIIYNNSIQILDYIGILCIWCALVLTLKWIKQYNVKAKQLIDDRALITNGQLRTDILRVIGRDEKWMLRETKKQRMNAYGDVFLGEYVDGKLSLTAY